MEEVSFLQKAITDIKRAIVIKIIFKIQIPYLYYEGINIGRNSFYFFSPNLICFASQSRNFYASPLNFLETDLQFWKPGVGRLANFVTQGTGVMMLLCYVFLPMALASDTSNSLVWKGTAVFSRGFGRGRLFL